LPEKGNSFSKLLKNKGFKKESMTKSGCTPSAHPRPWSPTRA
jgi:hypothetical protein